MDAMKSNLSREAFKGFFLFLLAEKGRHQEDIDMIDRKLNDLTVKLNLSLFEQAELVRESSKYISI